MKSILFIIKCNYPDGDANAVRQYSLAKLFQICGYLPSIFVLKNEVSDWSCYKNIQYKYCPKNILLDHVKQICESNHTSVALLNDIGDFKLFTSLKNYFVKKNIRIFHDAVEWYSSKQFKKGIFSRTYVKKEIFNRCLIDQKISVISISRYFEKYFEKKQIRTVRIPVVFDFEEIHIATFSKKTDYLKLIYIGAPGGEGYFKDDFKNIIEGIAFLDANLQKKIKIDIVGIYNNEVDLPASFFADISYHGRLKREKAVEILMNADFSILLRPVARYTKAGFPTKFAESMAFGIPTISNLTSDLNMYLQDMENGIVIEDVTPKAVSEAIKKAAAIHYEKLYDMKEKARCTAEKNFDLKLYKKEVEMLLEG